MKKFDIEERLIEFSVKIIGLAEKLPNTYAARHLGMQLIRSGTSPALNYGEAQSAESRQDFLHKIKIVLKELRESAVILKILFRRKYFDSSELEILLKECNELISIFVKSAQTVKGNIHKA